MAIDSAKEIDDVLGSITDPSIEESNTGRGEVASSFDPTEIVDALNMILQYEVSGMKVGIWLAFMLTALVVTVIVWLIVNKVKSHSDKERYERAFNYLSKVGDEDRRNMPLLMLLLLIFLLFIEASGFSYVFGQLMVNDASEQMLERVMIFGGFVLSAVLMLLTHFTGDEIHRNSILKAIEKDMADTDKEKLASDRDKFKRHQISLGNTYFDNNASKIVSQYNRLNQKYFDWKNYKTVRSYKVTTLTFALILFIGLGAMFVRFNTFEMGISSAQDRFYDDVGEFDAKTSYQELTGSKEEKLSDNNIPSHLLEKSKMRDEYRRSSEIEAERNASYITYAIMMILFFGIQLVGIKSGIEYSFVGRGREHKKAYKDYISYREKR